MKLVAVEDDSSVQQWERSDQHTAWGTTGLPWALHSLYRYTQQLGPSTRPVEKKVLQPNRIWHVSFIPHLDVPRHARMSYKLIYNL